MTKSLYREKRTDKTNDPKPKNGSITIQFLSIDDNAIIKLLGYENSLEWKQVGENLTIYLPENLSDSPVYSFKISPKPIE